jgi:SAM-dependent methyltransferase
MKHFLKSVHNIKRRLGRKLAGSNPQDLSWLLCSGAGLEVGARDNPYPFVKSTVKYADIADDSTIQSIADRYDFKRKETKYAKVDFILKEPKYGFDDIENNRFDFVYSDNVLEHTPNPIYALSEQFRILKSGGIIYCVIPNKKYTFDRKRSATPIATFIKKYNESIFDHSIDEAMDEILNREDHYAANWTIEDQLRLANEMISSKDGGPHYVVFDEINTLELINFFLESHPGSLMHFSALANKNIHFAISKI